jgi:hypothetical protein
MQGPGRYRSLYRTDAFSRSLPLCVPLSAESRYIKAFDLDHAVDAL